MKKMKQVTVKDCEKFIKELFAKYQGKGIETNYFFKLAEARGLYVRGTYGSPISIALDNLTDVYTISDYKGNYLYSVFRLA